MRTNKHYHIYFVETIWILLNRGPDLLFVYSSLLGVPKSLLFFPLLDNFLFSLGSFPTLPPYYIAYLYYGLKICHSMLLSLWVPLFLGSFILELMSSFAYLTGCLLGLLQGCHSRTYSSPKFSLHFLDLSSLYSSILSPHHEET